MNRTLTALKALAAKAAYDRGHQMFWTLDRSGPHQVLRGTCRECARTVTCDPHPPAAAPLSVAGTAVHEHCDALRRAKPAA